MDNPVPTLSFIASMAVVGLVSLGSLPASAAANRPDPPAGFTVAAERGAWVFRPAGDKDAELLIRVIGPGVSTKSPTEYLLAWVAGRPGPGAFSPPAAKPNFSVTTRETQIGTRKVIEAINAIRSERGRYFVEQILMPVDRAEMRDSIYTASGRITGAIWRDEMPNPPTDSAPPVREATVADAPLRVGTARSVAAQNIDAIDAIAFDSVTHFGYGGMLTFDPTPMVLFKSGDVAYMTVLNAPEGLAAHRAAHPKLWLRWRREGNAILIGTAQWRRLPYTKTLGPAPAGYRLTGNYQSLSGGGNIAVGGSSGVIAWSNLSFDRSGAFTSGGGSGSFTETNGGEARVATSGVRADEHGAYEVNGYALTLRYASGRVEQRVIVVDPKEPDVVWIDGSGWTRP
jgi:hypothetical protein